MSGLLNTLPDLPLVLKLALLALPMLFNLWGIYDAFKKRAVNSTRGTIWMCVCVFLPVLGGVAYLLIGRGQLKSDKKTAAGGLFGEKI